MIFKQVIFNDFHSSLEKFVFGLVQISGLILNAFMQKYWSWQAAFVQVTILETFFWPKTPYALHL